MMTLTHQVDRTVVIQATPAVVFAFLTETPRWATWWAIRSRSGRPCANGSSRTPTWTRRRVESRLMHVVTPLVLSGSGVLIAVLAYARRDDPDWQRDLPGIVVLALGLVAIGVVAWVLVQ